MTVNITVSCKSGTVCVNRVVETHDKVIIAHKPCGELTVTVVPVGGGDNWCTENSLNAGVNVQLRCQWLLYMSNCHCWL